MQETPLAQMPEMLLEMLLEIRWKAQRSAQRRAQVTPLEQLLQEWKVQEQESRGCLAPRSQ